MRRRNSQECENRKNIAKNREREREIDINY